MTVPIAFALVQKIPFDPFLIVWDRRQWLYLGCYYLIMFVPFFAAATLIGLALITKSEEGPRLYVYNLVGSAAGAALAVGLLEIVPVEQTMLVVAGLAQGAALLALFDAVAQPTTTRARQLAAVAVLAMLGTTLYFAARPPVVRLSQYKGLSYALNLPGARLLATRSSAIGRIDVVESPAIRQAPGLSLLAPEEAAIPSQRALFVDGETAGAITAFNGDTSSLGYLDWMSTAAPYFARTDSRSSVCSRSRRRCERTSGTASRRPTRGCSRTGRQRRSLASQILSGTSVARSTTELMWMFTSPRGGLFWSLPTSNGT